MWVVVVVGACCGDYKFNRGASGNLIMATVVALAVVVEISSVEAGLLMWCGFIGNDISDR